MKTEYQKWQEEIARKAAEAQRQRVGLLARIFGRKVAA